MAGPVNVPRAPRIAMVAGEASGDLLGAHLMQAVRTVVPDARFEGIGGARMVGAGFDAWFPAEALAVRGYVEVLRRLPDILRIRSELQRRLLANPPDLFIGVDAPDFNLALEERLRRRGIRTVQHVSPSLWAWRGKRIHQMRRSCDRVLLLFDFEAAIYREAGIPADFVGHPLADQLPEEPDRAAAREQFRLPEAAPVIALLPGSRESELQAMADLFVQTAQLIARQLPGVHFLVPLVSRHTRTQFEEALYRRDGQELSVTLLFGHAHMAMTAADGVLVASGTATLEAALLKRPMVVTYRMPQLSWMIGRPKMKLPWAALPNILAREFLVPEIYQQDARPEVLAQALLNLLADKEVRHRQQLAFSEIHARLRQDATRRIAQALLPMLRRG